MSGPKTISIWKTSPNLLGLGTGVAFLSFFWKVAKCPGSKIASGGV
jgi:hypothetical protein